MSMKVRRSPWTILAWPASLLLLLFLAWISGYVYWQVRIGRAIADLKREPAKYFNTPFYANPDLREIGSRGLHRMMGELDDAAGRGDEALAATFVCAIDDLLRGADEVDMKAAVSSGSYSQFREKMTLQEMREECREYRENGAEYRAAYAPWWKWWKGHRGRR